MIHEASFILLIHQRFDIVGILRNEIPAKHTYQGYLEKNGRLGIHYRYGLYPTLVELALFHKPEDFPLC